jgi:4-diphosphocytidyl-2-C-methyl-D-erythritol kinase
VGDVLTAEPSARRTLSLGGPFAIDLGAGDDNLVIRAVEGLAALTGCEAGAALHLDKRLPVASGIGGGSADAAAALRLAMRLWGVEPDAAALARLALTLGADVPVCLGSTATLMSGIGEVLSPAPPLPTFWMVLVNPLRGLSTAAVFNALERRHNPAGPPPPHRFADLGVLVAWLSRQRNDLEAPARQLLPAIGAVLGALRWQPTCRLARMSGSGATCFGLFAAEAEALAAADAIRRAEPGWWVAPAPVGSTPGAV